MESTLLIAYRVASPYAQRGIVWNAYTRHFGRDGDRVLVWKADTVGMNPPADRVEIDRAFEDEPASAATASGGEFRQDIESHVSPEAVEIVAVEGRGHLRHDPTLRHFAFADPAGRSGQDTMTLAIARREGDTSVVVRVVDDHFGGDLPEDRFRAQGISHKRADRPKTEICQSFLPLVNGRRVELLDHHKTLNQLLRLEKATGRTGKDTITHSRGAHDGLINTVAGVCVLSQHRKMLEGCPEPAAKLEQRQGGHDVIVESVRHWTCPAHRRRCYRSFGGLGMRQDLLRMFLHHAVHNRCARGCSADRWGMTG